MIQRIVCFTSDFGTEDTWVGVCHAVIHARCPSARVVDLSHNIAPYDVRSGAAVAASGVWQLPDAIHLVVVDPGVGGAREDLIVVTGGGTVLIGPDNGVLIPAAWRGGGVARAVAIDPGRVGTSEPLPTFHARDVLAPAAAALAAGADPGALGREVEPSTLAAAPFGRAVQEAGYIVAEVVDIDRFGSVRIAITAKEVVEHRLDRGLVEIGFGHVQTTVPCGRTFADVAYGEPVVLVDASGWLTLAVRMGSAAERYGVEPGVIARIRAAGDDVRPAHYA